MATDNPFKEVGPRQKLDAREAVMLTRPETASGPGRPSKGHLRDSLLGPQPRLAVSGSSVFSAYRRPEWVGDLAHKGGSTEDFVSSLSDYVREEPRGRRLWEAELLLNELARKDPAAVRRLLEQGLLERLPRSDRS